MEAIGGYFGIEELTGKHNSFPHAKGVLLNSGHNAFQYIYHSLPCAVDRIYMPYYTCPIMWENPLFVNGQLYFYRIDRNFELAEDVELGENDYIVVNNYFGLKDSFIAQLQKKYGNHMIIDNAQAFFAPVIPNTYAFYSPRKYVGVPDGGVAYLAENARMVNCTEQDDSSERLEHLFVRKEKGAEAGYGLFQMNEQKLATTPLRYMSDYTHEILKSIDYTHVIEKRKSNYKILQDALGDFNTLSLPSVDTFACPMVYPFIGKHDNGELRNELRKNRIYTAIYWPNLNRFENYSSVENYLAYNVLPLPIDQRYNEEDMKRIIEIILDYRNGINSYI